MFYVKTWNVIARHSEIDRTPSCLYYYAQWQDIIIYYSTENEIVGEDKKVCHRMTADSSRYYLIGESKIF